MLASPLPVDPKTGRADHVQGQEPSRYSVLLNRMQLRVALQQIQDELMGEWMTNDEPSDGSGEEEEEDTYEMSGSNTIPVDWVGR